MDDYVPTSTYDTWFYSRIGTDRGAMGNGDYQVSIGGGAATVSVTTGWAGVWTSLLHRSADIGDSLDPLQLLGSYVFPAYQPRIVGVEVDIIDGSGSFKLELKDGADAVLHKEIFQLAGGQQTLEFPVSPTQPLKLLNWIIDGPGHATVDEIRFVLEGPTYPTREAVFLFSYGHLSQCYDAASGLVRDRARWPVADYAAVPAIGMFALATVVAFDRGYINHQDANAIVSKTTTTLASETSIPRYRGLLPHFLKNGDISPDTEWSSVDTAIALISGILAAQRMGLDTAQLEQMLREIDWADLTDNFTRSISHGYDAAKNKLLSRWDTFGGETFLLAVAFAAANNGQAPVVEAFPLAPTWDGSGFNDEISALLFPMTGTDHWTNNWNLYRCRAFEKQHDYFDANAAYRERGLFGLSASEVPEPWEVADPPQRYAAWGVGGHNGTPLDGTGIVGYPIVAPHYAAMVASENPTSAERLFEYLASLSVFSPLNNVESLGLAPADPTEVKWNALKGSWNLVLQALGAGRSLSGAAFAPHLALAENAFLRAGYESLLKSHDSPCTCESCMPARGGWRAILDADFPAR